MVRHDDEPGHPHPVRLGQTIEFIHHNAAGGGGGKELAAAEGGEGHKVRAPAPDQGSFPGHDAIL